MHFSYTSRPPFGVTTEAVELSSKEAGQSDVRIAVFSATGMEKDIQAQPWINAE